MKFAFLAVLASLVSGPSYSQEAPANVDANKIDFTQVLKDLDGNPYTECKKADDKNPNLCIETAPATLGWLVAYVVNKTLQSDTNPNLDDILMRNRLARQVYTQATSLTATEKSFIENRMAKFGFDAVEVGAAIAILDPPQVKK